MRNNITSGKKNIFMLAAVLVVLFSTGHQASAADYLLARILKVDLANKQVVVLRETTPENSTSTQIKSETKPIVVSLSPELWEVMPACLQDGELIRLRGSSNSQKNSFVATEIRGTRGWQKDRSGVRARLGRGWRHGWRRRADMSLEP